MIQMTLWATVLFYISVSICIHSSTATDKKWSFIGVPCQEREFCGNQGSCTFFPKLQVKACNCPDGFEGERCEFVSISTEAVKGERDSSLCGANLTIGVILIIISVISLCLLFLVCFLVYQLHRKIHKERCPVSRPLLEEMETRDRENRKAHSTFLKRFLGLDALSAGNSAVATRRNSVMNQRTLVQTTLSTTPSAVEVPQKIPQGATRWAQTIRRTILRTEVSVVDQQPEQV